MLRKVNLDGFSRSRVSRPLATSVYGVVGIRKKGFEGVLTSLSIWLKPLNLSPLKRAMRQHRYPDHAINGVAKCRFAESRLKAAEINK